MAFIDSIVDRIKVTDLIVTPPPVLLAPDGRTRSAAKALGGSDPHLLEIPAAKMLRSGAACIILVPLSGISRQYNMV